MASRERQGQSVTLVLVDSHAAQAKGMELLLRHIGHHVVGVAGEPETAYQMIDARRPQVAMIDIGLPGENGTRLTRRLLQRDAKLAVLLHIDSTDHGLLPEALDCGARGLALKTSGPDELAEAIFRLAGTGTYLDPRLKAMLASGTTTEPVRLLSPREREILEQIARGIRNQDIATVLSISPETVRTHTRNALEKLEVHTRAHAVAIALRDGEIDL